MSKIEYLIWQCDTTLHLVTPRYISTSPMWYDVTPRYISTSPKQKLRNNVDVIDYFADDNQVKSSSL